MMAAAGAGGGGGAAAAATTTTSITTKHIPVVRIPRTYSNQVVPSDVYEVPTKVPVKNKIILTSHPQHDEESLVYDEDQHDSRKSIQAHTDVFSLTMPPSQNEKESKDQQYFSQSKRIGGTSQSPVVIQQQPEHFSSLIKPSAEFENRPHLNWKSTKKWQNGLCTFCDDFNLFCYACSCWCCFRHELSKMLDEHWIIWFCQCSPLMALRTKFRQFYRIRGSIAEDCCLSYCCPLCVGLQIANEGRHYGHRIFT